MKRLLTLIGLVFLVAVSSAQAVGERDGRTGLAPDQQAGVFCDYPDPHGIELVTTKRYGNQPLILRHYYPGANGDWRAVYALPSGWNAVAVHSDQITTIQNGHRWIGMRWNCG